jgi:hypothetical protein
MRGGRRTRVHRPDDVCRRFKDGTRRRPPGAAVDNDEPMNGACFTEKGCEIERIRFGGALRRARE